MREFMPLHGGWSDSVFMDIPILAMAGALSGDRKYFDMAARHSAFMQTIVRRPDGLYRHQASSDAAWGRGNGFPALGMALTLSTFPKDHAEYPTLLASFQRHMKTLAALQDENGMFREVIDHPGAYPEYSGTTMIATAMLRGIRKGWLDAATYQPIVDRAWQAVVLCARHPTDGCSTSPKARAHAASPRRITCGVPPFSTSTRAAAHSRCSWLRSWRAWPATTECGPGARLLQARRGSTGFQLTAPRSVAAITRR